MAFLSGDHPRSIPRAVWLAARARNAIHRPVFIWAIGVSTLIAAVLALVLAPRQIKRPGEPRLSQAARPDTAPLVAALVQSRTRLSTAENSLAQARVHAASIKALPVDTLSPLLIKQRDSLAALINDLDALLTRVETAPVAASYRALAESPQLTASPRMKPLVDSLVEVERDRDSYAGTGAADPMYVALSARATEIGRSIQSLAQQRRDALREQIAKVNAPAQQRQAIAEAPAVDTAGWVAERDSAQSLVSQASTALADARERSKDYDQAVKRAKELASTNASPFALLGAALVIGCVIGFGAAFVDEMRRPRISADQHEVERLTGARVISMIAPRPKQPDRSRRSADRAAPRYFDPGADGYQLTYLHVARAGASRLMLTVASSDTGIAAVVAMNVAAIAADEARSTIIIDTDARTSPVAAALRSHAEPGLADIMQRQLDWAGVATQAPVGRDRYVDLIPSGISSQGLDPARVTELLRQESPRLLRHYEAVIVTTSIEQAVAGLPGALPIPDTIICARVGHTRIADVNVAIDRIRAAGGNTLGIVLWNAFSPALPSPDRIARSPRPVRTEEMQAMTTAG